MIKGSDINGKVLEESISYSDSIKIAIKNLMWLNKLDILEYDPTKGIGLKKYIGQPLDDITIYNIRTHIIRTLSVNEQRIENTNVNVTYNSDYNGIVIELYYIEKLSGTPQELILNYEL